jgi:hypothetical protein
MVYEMREIAPGKNIVTVEIKTQLKGFGGTIKGIGIKSWERKYGESGIYLSILRER